jgi:hypothetical protein
MVDEEDMDFEEISDESDLYFPTSKPRTLNFKPQTLNPEPYPQP